MNTNWEFVEHELLQVVKENVRYLSEAMDLEDKIKEMIQNAKH